MSERRRLTTGFVLVTIALAIALGIRPVPTERILAAYVLALAALALASLVRTVAARQDSRQPSAFERALERQRATVVRPPELVLIERDIVLGGAQAGHFHSRLRPLLRDVAATRLAAHHSVDLDRQPDAARRLLGDEAWAVVRPDVEKPEDLYAPGVPLARLRGVVGALEGL